MTPYIGLCHAAADRDAALRLSDMLARYGFRTQTVSEEEDAVLRGKLLAGATALVLLCSPAAREAELLIPFLRRAAERTYPPICVDLGTPISPDDGEAALFSTAVRVPFPTGETPDRHAVGLFAHRLMIRRLSAIPGLFNPAACASDELGTVLRYAARAHAGDAEATYALGCAYECGYGVPLLESEAAAHLAVAARAGLPDARLHLGELYADGRGVEVDLAEAFRLFSRSAETGDLRGEYRRGLCYLLGIGVIKDPERAAYYLRRAAHAGYAPALYRLGLLCRDGVGTTAHAEEAIRHLYAACRHANVAEGHALPTLFCRRDGRRPRCITVRHLRRRLCSAGRVGAVDERVLARCRATRIPLAAEALDDLWGAPDTVRGQAHTDLDATAVGVSFAASDAAVALGQLLETGCPAEGVTAHPTRAAAWYRYAASLGHAEGYRRLGDLYRRGIGLPADPAYAVRLYRRGALGGDEVAAFSLAVCCERGIGTRPDPAEAVRFYEQAANAGYAPAQNNLGGCYEYGHGVSADMLTAVEWYVRAADAGQPDATCRLGLCYECGRGVQTDLRQAFRFYETAARLGHGYALYRLGVCYSRGTYPDSRDAVGGSCDETRPLHSRAVELWEAAAERGVPEAAYALSMSYALGRGVRRDERLEHACLLRAAAGDSLQAHSRLGFAYLEGRGCPRDTARARAAFARAAALWRERRVYYLLDDAPLPAGVISPSEAAGAALYMEGYCILNGIGGTTSASGRTPEQTERAVARFREAAVLEYVGALEMLGDLYAYGILTAPYDADGDSHAPVPLPGIATAYLRSTDPMVYYREAARVGASHNASGGRCGDRADASLLALTDEVSPDCTVYALMSMAYKTRRLADTLRTAGDAEGAERAWREIWRSYAAAAEQGSADALVGMAECIYYGYGMTQNRPAAQKLLVHAERRTVPASNAPGGGAVGQRIAASLWLGDFLRCGWCGDCRLSEADDAYLCAIATPSVGTEGSEYILAERRAARLEADRRARAEAYYRIAAFRAIYFPDDPARAETFPYLARAVLMGHEAARRDLARMYAFETDYAAATMPGEGDPSASASSDRPRRGKLRRRKGEGTASTARDRRAVRSHSLWLTDYYTALWLEPRPFFYELRSVAVPSDIPAYATAEVTPAMTVSALNYLGDCWFYGRGVPEDPAAAVACWREAVSLRGEFDRSGPLPPGMTWAQYSLGWCLLYGHGVARDPREAVKYLTAAARTHAEACYTLAGCHERGDGVDVADAREAIKYYRKALKLGLGDAEDKVDALERQLHDLSDEED